MKSYYAYIITNHSRTLYVGVTGDIHRRIYQHQKGEVGGFSKRYKLHTLVYFQETSDIKSAIQWEKRLKGWVRSKNNPFDRAIESVLGRFIVKLVLDPSASLCSASG